jgi:imidazolonepropionase-like amidohydrolase
MRGLPSDHPKVVAKRAAFEAARASGVTIANGSDIGVFPHGENARELELLVEHGLTPAEALRAATSTAASVLRRGDLGVVAAGARADFACVLGDPATEITSLRNVMLVLKNGVVEWSVHGGPG